MQSFKSLRRRLQAIYPKSLRKGSSVKQQGISENIEQATKAGSVLNDTRSQSDDLESVHERDHSRSTLEDNHDEMRPTPRLIECDDRERSTRGKPSIDQEPAASVIDQEAESDIKAPEIGVNVIFNGEDESDYTDGPIRIIGTTDGVKYCAALLMNLDLSAKIKNAMEAQRFFAKAEASANQELDALFKLDSKLRRQVLDHECRVARLNEDDTAESSKQEDLKEELRILKLMREANKDERTVVSTNLAFQGTELRKAQSAVIADLEEPFVFAQLLEAEVDTVNEPVRELDLEQEFQAFRAGLDEYGGSEEIDAAPFQTYTNNMELFGPLTEQETREKEVKEGWWAASDRLLAAERAFNNRESERAAEWDANLDAEAQGEEALDASQEDYDMRMLKREQELTRELIDAEEGFAAAKVAARNAGLDLGAEDQTSEFVDDVEDGYRLSFEEVRTASVPEPVVHNWLDSMPSPATPSFNERFDHGDEWQADDVEMSDSISLVAEGAERRKIDKWRRVCGL